MRTTALCILMCLFAAGAAFAASDGVSVRIMATTDIHGALMPYDYINDRPAPGNGLIKLASIVKTRRRLDPDLLLIDVGDTFQGNPMIHLANTDPSFSRNPMAAVMNAMGYNLMVLGNHDFDYGLDTLERIENELDFPLVAANVLYADTRSPRWKPYMVKEVHGVRVGILGITSPGISGWLPAANWKGLVFDASIKTAMKYVPILRERENCDLVVVAFHGGPRPKDGQADDNVNNGFELAMNVKDIDLLVLGHTHKLMHGRRVGKTLIIQPASHSQYLAEADFRFTCEGAGFRLALSSARLYRNGPALPVDRDLLNLVEEPHRKTLEYLNKPLARLDRELKLDTGAYHDTALIDMIQRIQLDFTGARLSVCSLFDPYTVFRRSVTRRSLMQLYPFENTLYTVQMTGAQIREFLENAASAYSFKNGRLGINDDFPLFNLDFLQGLDYVIDPRRPVGSRVVELLDNGERVPDDREYTVAMNSYRAGGSGGYDVMKRARILRKSRLTVREIIERALLRRSFITPGADNNWRIDPGAAPVSFQALVK